jgi:hypothetical protein
MTFDVKQYFQAYRAPTWLAPSESVPQEHDPGQVEIQPTGWVINSSANVIIDDEGLHVSDGSIFIEDAFGSVVLSASGFDGSWQKFLTYGLYNADFAIGLPVGTSINVGTTDIPYWTVVTKASSATLTREIDLDAPSGTTLKYTMITGSLPSIVSMEQIVPVVSGRKYLVRALIESIEPAGPAGVDVTIGHQFLDINQDPLDGVHAQIATFLGTSGTYDWYTNSGVASVPAPAGAAYAKVLIQFERFTPTGTDTFIINLGAVEFRPADATVMELTIPDSNTNEAFVRLYADSILTIEGMGLRLDDVLQFGNDVTLQRTAANELSLGIGDSLSIPSGGQLIMDGRAIKTVDVNLPAGGTTFIPDANISQVGSALVASNGNNGSGVISWYRAGTFNGVNGMSANPAGPWEFRGSTFSAGAGFFSFFIESNLAGARLAIKNNAGFATSVRMLVF